MGQDALNAAIILHRNKREGRPFLLNTECFDSEVLLYKFHCKSKSKKKSK